MKITNVYVDAIYVCTACKWEGPEYKLSIGGKGLTHYYVCPVCNSAEVLWEDDDDLRSKAV